MTRCTSSSPPTASPARSRPARPPRRWPKGGVSAAPHDRLTLLPLSDGGPGFCRRAHPSPRRPEVAVPSATRSAATCPPPCSWPSTTVGRTVYVETAQACGLHLLGRDERDPSRTSSYGVGSCSRRRWPSGRTVVVVGLGAAAPTTGAPACWPRSGSAPRRRSPGAAPGWPTSPTTGCRGWSRRASGSGGVELVVATDVDLALLGLQGASASAAADKGATPEVAQQLEGALGRLHRGRAAHPAAGQGPAHRCRPAAGPRAGGRRRRWSGLRPAAARRPRPERGRRGAAGRRFRRPARCRGPAGHRRGGASTGRACTARWWPASPRPRWPWPSPPSCWPGRPSSAAGRRWRSGSAGPTRWRSAPTGCRLFEADPAGTLAARAARVATTWSPAPRRHVVRLTAAGNTSRRPWVGTVDRTPLRRAVSS